MFSKLSSRFGLAPKTLTAALLVAGTCIGGGMLALPVSGAPAGLIPGLLIMSVVWVFMTATGLCLVEIGLWLKKKDAHLVTMASTILGDWGKWLVWGLFLFISYASLTAYTAGCGSLFAEALSSLFKTEVSKTAGCWLFVFVFGPWVASVARVATIIVVPRNRLLIDVARETDSFAPPHFLGFFLFHYRFGFGARKKPKAEAKDQGHRTKADYS